MTYRDKKLKWPSQKRIEFLFEEETLTAVEGETIAAALAAAGKPLHGEHRVFCGMGECQQCLVTVNGQPSQRACKTIVKDQMRIFKQGTKVDLPEKSNNGVKSDKYVMESKVEAVVVGAGPSGMACATYLAQNGLCTLIVDESDSLGGQYYKQRQANLDQFPENRDARQHQGRVIIDNLLASKADVRLQTTVWHAENLEHGGVRLLLSDGNRTYAIETQFLVIATGARETPLAIPGWDLPGVISCGAMQIYKRRYGIEPKGPCVFLGNGPLLLNVASDFSGTSSKVLTVLETGKVTQLRHIYALTSMVQKDVKLVLQGIRYQLNLIGQGIRYRSGVKPIRIVKHEEDLQVEWLDAKESLHKTVCKTVVMSGGLVPNNELSRLLGAYPQDNNVHTNLKHIFIVGESSQIGGYKKALLEGEAAAKEICQQFNESAQYEKVIQFQQALHSIFKAEPLDIHDETIVCRCEQIRANEIRQALRAGVSSFQGLKQLTRVGMGHCQGRTCLPTVERLLTESAIQFEPPTQRIPLRPISLSMLSEEQPEWLRHLRAKPNSLIPQETKTKQSSLTYKPSKSEFIVIGGGLIGLFSAFHLVRLGYEVRVIDGGRTNGQASGGNAGSLHAQLLSFDFDDSRALMPADHTLALQCEAIEYWKQCQSNLNADFELSQFGGLMVAGNDIGIAKLAKKVAREQRLGVNVDLIDACELNCIEPYLAPHLKGAALCQNEGKVNPHKVATILKKALIDLGVTVVENSPVYAITQTRNGFRVDSSSGSYQAHKIINAAGAWSGEIAKLLGSSLPVYGAPLQMMVTEAVQPVTKRLIAHVDRHLTLKQAKNGNFIIGGGWTAGYDERSNRSKIIEESLRGNAWVAEHVMPRLGQVKVIRAWGAMNIDIDGAPIVGEDTKIKGFYHAVTSNGVTLAPLVGQMIAQLAGDGVQDRIRPEFMPKRFV